MSNKNMVIGGAPGQLEPTINPGITSESLRKKDRVIVLVCRSPRFDDVASAIEKYGITSIKDDERQKRGVPALNRSGNLSRWPNKNRKIK